LKRVNNQLKKYKKRGVEEKNHIGKKKRVPSGFARVAWVMG